MNRQSENEFIGNNTTTSTSQSSNTHSTLIQSKAKSRNTTDLISNTNIRKTTNIDQTKENNNNSNSINQNKTLKIVFNNVGGAIARRTLIVFLSKNFDMVLLCELIINTVEDLRDWLPSNKVFNFNESSRYHESGRSVNGMTTIKSEWVGGKTCNIGDNMMKTSFENIIIISVYLTNNNQTFINHMKFTNEIASIQTELDKNKQDKKYAIIIGDFNASDDKPDPSDETYKSMRQKDFINFIEKNDLKLILDQEKEHPPTYVKNTKHGQITSRIDHAIVSKSFQGIVKFKIGDDEDINDGEHKLIQLEIIFPKSAAEYEEKIIQLKTTKLDLNNSKNVKDYSAEVQERIKVINNEFDTKLINKDTAVKTLTKTITDLYKAMLETRDKTAIKANKRKKDPHSKNKTWWSEPWQQEHIKANRHYNAWLKSGKKLEKEFEQYIHHKDESRRIKRLNIKLMKKKQFTKFDLNQKRNLKEFYNEIKKKTTIKQTIEAEIDELEEMFKSLFNDKLQDTVDDPIKVKRVEDFMEINDHPNKIHDFSIQPGYIEQILKKLPNNKAAGYTTMTYELFKYAISVDFIKLLENIFNNMIQYSAMPRYFNISIVKPLVKDPKKPSYLTNNLRPIAISDPLTNIFERLIKKEFNRVYKSENLQFGFKTNSSCQHAIFVLNECIANSLKSGKTIYIIAIDASKAFDKINRWYLYYTLIILGMPAALIVILIKYYGDAYMMVYVNGTFSRIFQATRGIKQGGSASPDFWSYYSKFLTREIDESELGITINARLTIGSIMFADDTTLIANSVETCKKLLAITDKYGIDYEITYNGDKTDLIIISPHQNTEDISGLKLNGKQITKSESLKFLGSMISSNNTNTTHINSRIDKLNKGLFSLRHSLKLCNSYN